MTQEQADKIISLLERLVDQQEEIMEKLDNISRPGADYGIEED